MRFPLKSKLAVGLTFLFVAILTLGVVSIYYINKLSSDSEAILKDNYNSLIYANSMLKALDEMPKTPSAISDFENTLKKQEQGATETSEVIATKDLRNSFEHLKLHPTDTAYYNSIRKQIYFITDLNHAHINKKNELAEETSKQATTWVAIVASILILIAFSFIINFPGYIANPIKTLTEGIKEIANKNYSQRIYFSSGDEFGELAIAFNQMAAQLDNYEHSNLSKLMFEKKRIEAIIGQMNDATIGLDDNKKILFINSIAESLLMVKANDVVGSYAPDVALRNDLLRSLLVKDGKDHLLKIVIDGKENFFTKEYKDVMNGTEPIGEVIVLKNITYFKELDVSKTNFIATISHELKTPISSIKMSLKLLNDNRVGAVNKEQGQLIENINEDADRLLKITSELLDLTQIESGKIQLHKQKVLPSEIITTAVDATEVQAQQKQVALEVNCDSTVPKIEADADKTSWVLINLISNAIRHSPDKSKVVISVEPDTTYVIFSVKDFGTGIDKKYQEGLFNRYFKIPGASQDSGTGLGLAISKEFIESQNGTIWVESEAGKGSEFKFKLPSTA
jgi:signal transduction histidine kinase